jgi:hypothetical protein
MAHTLFLSRKLSINVDYCATLNPGSALRKFENKIPQAQASDDSFGEKVWDWNVDAMRKATRKTDAS